LRSPRHLIHAMHGRRPWQALGSAGLVGALFFGDARPAQAQSPWHGLEEGAHQVGLRVLEERDPARVVGNANDPRPVRVYVWYPAVAGAGDEPMAFRRYAELAEDDVWPRDVIGALRDSLGFARRPLTRSLSATRLDALLEQPLLARENAAASTGPFPLIVVGQGLYYESPIAQVALSEHLASLGFVVATAPLAGRHSPLATITPADLETQVRDLEFVLARARRLPYVSRDLLGVAGFDMGGMAGLILAMRNPDVDALVTMDAGVLFPDRSTIPAASPDHDPSALRIPWLHATQRVLSVRPEGLREPSLYDTAVHSERYLLLTDSVAHVAYTSFALVEGRAEVPGYWRAWESRETGFHQALARYVGHFFEAFLNRDAESLVVLAEEPESFGPGVGVSVQRRTPEAAPITYAELVSELVTGDAVDALARVRALRGTDPSHPLLDDTNLRRLTVSLLFTWELDRAARAVIELGLELNPDNAWGRPYLEFLDRTRPTGR
jgi:hypothetical protein